MLGLLAVASGLPSEPEAEPVPNHSEEEVKEAREEFDSIDTNHDGFISREEILEMEEVPEREEIDEFFNTYDKNADNRVTFEEILESDEEVCRHSASFFIHAQMQFCHPHPHRLLVRVFRTFVSTRSCERMPSMLTRVASFEQYGRKIVSRAMSLSVLEAAHGHQLHHCARPQLRSFCGSLCRSKRH